MGNPLPVNLEAECRKANKIVRLMVDPVNGVDGVIPLSVLRKARGFAIFSVFRIGFIMSARAGSGVVIGRLPDGGWSAPAALGIGGLGGGFNAGAEVTDFLIVLNTDAAVRSFMATGSLQLGGNMSVAVGPVGRSAEASGAVNSSGKVAAMYSYSRSKGVYAGISLEGTVLLDRSDANSKAYGRPGTTAKQLLSGAVEVPQFASDLIGTLEKFTMSGGQDDPFEVDPAYGTRDSLERQTADMRLSVDDDDDYLNQRRKAEQKRKEEADARNTGAYAFGSQAGGSGGSPRQARSSLGKSSGRSTDYSSNRDGTDFVGDESAYAKPKYGRQSSVSSLGSFARAGVQERKGASSSPQAQRRVGEGSTHIMTNRKASTGSTGFSTKFARTESSEEDLPLSSARASEPAPVDGGWGLASREKEKSSFMAGKIGSWGLGKEEEHQRLSDMDALDRELQGGGGGKSNSSSPKATRPPISRSSSGMQAGADGWRSDYGYSDANPNGGPAGDKRPGFPHGRTSSASKLWNRVRGTSFGSSAGRARNDSFTSNNSKDARKSPAQTTSWKDDKKYAPTSSHLAEASHESARPSTESSSDEWGEAARAQPMRAHSPPALMGDSPPPSLYAASTNNLGPSPFSPNSTVFPTAFPSSVPSSPASPAAPAASASGGGKRVVASFDFVGQEAGDLSFSKGDVIEVLNSTGDRDDWWVGRARGKVGSFPANYTEDI